MNLPLKARPSDAGHRVRGDYRKKTDPDHLEKKLYIYNESGHRTGGFKMKHREESRRLFLLLLLLMIYIKTLLRAVADGPLNSVITYVLTHRQTY